MKTIKIDGVDQIIWKMDLERCTPNPSFVKSEPLLDKPLLRAKKGKIFEPLKLAVSNCTGKLLMSERRLTYCTNTFLHPEALTAIDTKNNLLYTAQGKDIPATISVTRLSIDEAAFVQSAIKSADDKEQQKRDDEWKCKMDRRFEQLAKSHLELRQQAETPLDPTEAVKLYAIINKMDSEQVGQGEGGQKKDRCSSPAVRAKLAAARAR
jgi:hypothetical protein